MTKPGMKADEGKLRMELLSPTSIEGLAQVLTFGAKKYEDRNWEKGIAWSRVYGALQRHLSAFWGGRDTDYETGLPHLDHAACCIHFLQHYARHNEEFDDRPQYLLKGK